jgi:hypothetical protein
VRKNAQIAVIEDFGEAFCSMINDFVAEKIKNIEKEAEEEAD